MRRWRGMKDVPLTYNGIASSIRLGADLELDAIYHDRLERCRDTAELMIPNVTFPADGPLPWDMGHLFEGQEINEESIELARHYVQNPDVLPPGGEKFLDWSLRWYFWIRNLRFGFASVGVVTHNRNIQYLYAIQHGSFKYHMYDCHGPDFCSVHVYDQRHGWIEPWGGKNVPRGLYLIRHGETSYGT